MKNADLARMFEEIAAVMEIIGESSFRILSYHRAARAMEELPQQIEEVARDGKLMDIPGIGKSIAAKIDEYLQTGQMNAHKEMLARIPPSLAELLMLPGMGPKTAQRLWRQAGVGSVQELERVIENEPEKLTTIPGIGPKKIRQMWESLAFAKTAQGRTRLGEATMLSEELLAQVRAIPGVQQAQAAGSLRRGKDTVGDIDLLCQAPEEDAGRIIGEFVKLGPVRKVIAGGMKKGSVLLDRQVQADLRVVPGESYGSALAYFTGSKEHNVKLREIAVKKKMKLNEYGLFSGKRSVAGADEEGIYRHLGLQFVPPELRENRGEVEAAMLGQLPRLVELADIRGDLHMHTEASDGTNTIDEMIQACVDRGYSYMAICEHSKAQAHAGGLDEKQILAHANAIRTAARKHKGIRVFAGVEVDIFKDGSLDFDVAVLGELDFVVASAHSALGMARGEATRRIIKAIETPHVHCIGHPAGRVINSRPGMDLDMEAVAAAAAANNVALEINSQHMRLDLRDIHARTAIEKGARLIISTDAHNISELDYIAYGVTTARRGWATAGDVLNTLTADEFLRWVTSRAG